MDYAEFQLCREMGWTFAELADQPAWRVEQAFAFLNEEAKDSERRNKSK